MARVFHDDGCLRDAGLHGDLFHPYSFRLLLSILLTTITADDQLWNLASFEKSNPGCNSLTQMFSVR